VRLLLAAEGYELDEAEVAAVMARFDADEGGTLDREEYAELAEAVRRQREADERAPPLSRKETRRQLVELMEVGVGLALSHCRVVCTTTHPLHTRFTNIFGASISEVTMRPDPRSAGRAPRAAPRTTS
jgi:hypothetical protein